MPVIACPNCAKRVKLPETFTANTFDCPGCKVQVQVQAQVQPTRSPALPPAIPIPKAGQVPLSLTSTPPTALPLSLDPLPNPPAPRPLERRTTRISFPGLPVVLSGLALLVAIAAMVVAITRDPLGKGLSAYDFSTPEAAARSDLEIEANGDLRAAIDLGRLRQGQNLKDAVRTMEVSRTVDYGSTKVLFVSYMSKGVKKKKVMGFEKDLETKMWLPKSVYSFEIRKKDEKLAKEMDAWTEKDVD